MRTGGALAYGSIPSHVSIELNALVMLNNSKNNERIAKNSILLYMRMVILMFITLFSVRVVLNALGLEDYGIYNAVAGIVTMLNCVTTVMSTAIQRYYSYTIGQNRLDKIDEIFSSSVIIFCIFSLIVFIFSETLGVWFLNRYLSIPEEKLLSANWVFQAMILSFIFSIFQIPYSALILAHERMGLYALLTTSLYIFQLILTYSLFCIDNSRLLMYGVYMAVSQCLLLVLYVVITKKQKLGAKFRLTKDKALYKEILSFSSWSLFSPLAGVGMNQVNTILVNIFFGSFVTAARSISIQIYAAINSFCSSFILAVRPPMIKAYAENDFSSLNALFNISNKFVYYSLLVVSLPLIFEMEIVLKLWLGKTDCQTVLFSQLMVIYTLILSLNHPISIIVQATGKVKEYNLPVETITLLCPVLTYYLFKNGYPAESLYVSMIICISLSHVIRLICLKRFYKFFKCKTYIVEFILPAILVTIICVLVCLTIKRLIYPSLYRLVVSISFSFFSVIAFGYTISLSRKEKQMIKCYIKNKSNGL